MTTRIMRLLGLCILVSLSVVLGPLAQAAERVTWYHHDLQGSPVAATDGNGAVVWREQYKPYGERTLKEDGGSNKLWYTGKAHEEGTRLSYFGARWYHPEIGRFMSVDPVDFTEDNVQSFNRYAYANNNPYRYADPDGESPLDVVFLAYDVGKLGVAIYTGQGVGAALADVGTSLVGVASPIPGTGQAIKAAKAAAKAGEAVGKTGKVANGTNKAPDFVVSTGGTAFPVPKGATGPTPVVNPAGNQSGVAFTGGAGGANGQVSTMRIMNPTPARGNSPGYPSGYIKYENSASPKPQGVDPYSGKTLPNSRSHFSID